MQKKFSLSIPAFIIAFILGLIYVYISAPKQKHVIKYPTPFNSEKIIYKNYDNICYKYKAEEVICDASSINQPIS